MKKSNFKVTAILFILFLSSFQACKKYEDNTFIAIRTPESRLRGEWILTGGDTYDADKELIFEFKRGGDFIETSTNSNGETTITGGSWQLDANKESIEIDLDGTTNLDNYDILKLSNSNMRIQNNNDKIYEFESN